MIIFQSVLNQYYMHKKQEPPEGSCFSVCGLKYSCLVSRHSYHFLVAYVGGQDEFRIVH